MTSTLTTPSRKRNNDNDRDNDNDNALETPGILSRLFSSKKKPRIEERSDRIHRLPSPVIPNPLTNRLTRTVETMTTATAIATTTTTMTTTSPVFHLGMTADRRLPSQARRSKTYFKPSSRTLILRKYPRNSNSDNNNPVNKSKTIAALMQNSKGTLFPTIMEAPTNLYRSLPGQRILGSHQTNSRLTHYTTSPKTTTPLLTTNTTLTTATTTTTSTTTPAPLRKSVKFEAEVTSFLTPAVPKMKIQRLQTPAPKMSPSTTQPTSTSSSSTSFASTPYKNIPTPDGPFVFTSTETTPTTTPTTPTTLTSNPTMLCTRTYSCKGVPVPIIDLSACYDPQPLITLQPRDRNKITVHEVIYSIDEDEENNEMEQKKPRTDTFVPPPIPLSWAELPAMAGLNKGMWQCTTCSSFVDDSETKCVACQAAKPGTLQQKSEPSKVTTGVFSGSGFTFGTTAIPTKADSNTGGTVQPNALPVITGGFIFSATKPVDKTKGNEQVTPPKFSMATTRDMTQTEPRKKRALTQEDDGPKTEGKKPAFGRDQFNASAMDHAMPTIVFGVGATVPPLQDTTFKHPGPSDSESTNTPAPASTPFRFGASTATAATQVAPPFFSTSTKPAPSTIAPSIIFGSSAPVSVPESVAPSSSASSSTFGASTPSATPATKAPLFTFGVATPADAPAIATEAPLLTFGSSTPAAVPAPDAPLFTFGASTPAAVPATATDAPLFTFGSSTPAAVPAPDAPLFTFGANTPAAPATATDAPLFMFGSSTPAATATDAPLFTFGASTPAAVPAPVGNAPFSFRSSTVTAPAGDAPFSFGSSTATAAPVSAAPLFSFGSSSTVPAPAIDAPFSFGSSTTPAAPVPGSLSFGNAPQSAPAFSVPAPSATSASSFPFGTSTPAHVTFGGTPAVSFGSQPPLSVLSAAPTFTAPSFGGTPGFGFVSTPAGFAVSGGAHVTAAPATPAFGFGVGAPAALSSGFGGMSQPTTPAAPASFGTPHVATPQVGGFSIGTGGANKGTVGPRRRAVKAKRPPSSGRML